MLVLGAGMVLGLPLRARLGAALVLVALYVPLAGGGPSIQRAGVMGAAGPRRGARRPPELALVRARPCRGGDARPQPARVRGAGLAALLRRRRRPARPRARAGREALRRARVPGLLADAIAVTAAATLATAPLMALHFEQVSLASLPANLVAAPAVAPVMWLGMGSIALAQIAPVAVRAAERAQRIAARLPGVGRARGRAAARGRPAGADRRPGRARRVLRRGSGAAGARGTRVAAGGPAAAARAAGGARRRARSPRSPSSFAHRAPPPPRPGELVVSFLDVGQGDATLLQRDGASLLVDTGPPGGPILRRLSEAGVKRLDALLLTHAEADHEGMALEIVRAFRPRLVLDGGAGWPTAVQRGLPAARVRTVAAHAGQELALGGVRLRLLWPPPPAPGLAARRQPQRSRRRGSGERRPVRPAAAGRRGVGGHRLARPARRRGAQGGPPRQRRPGSARPARAHASRSSPRSRSGAATPTGTRRRRRSRPFARRCRRWCAPTATAPCGCASWATARGWSAVRRPPAPIVTSTASRLGRRARLQARLPRPRRRPRPHRRAAREAARAGGGGERRRGRRGARGRRVHGRRGHRRADDDDLRDGPPLRDRRRGGALEGRRRRGGRRGDGRHGRRDAHARAVRPRGVALQGARRVAQGGRGRRAASSPRRARSSRGSSRAGCRRGRASSASSSTSPAPMRSWPRSATASSGCCASSRSSRSSTAQGAAIGVAEIEASSASSAERKAWTLADALVAGDEKGCDARARRAARPGRAAPRPALPDRPPAPGRGRGRRGARVGPAARARPAGRCGCRRRRRSGSWPTSPSATSTPSAARSR